VTRTADWVKAACITVLGAGYLRPAPGTWGSLFAIVLFLPLWGLARVAHLPALVVNGLILAGILCASRLAVQWGGWAIARWGRSDPRQFTLDEFAGQWTALLFLPLSITPDGWLLAGMLLSQFFLFRVFDVIKPPPARQAEALPAGWGILVDDLFAGIYANIVGQVLWRVLPLAVWLHL
jgi:phosphatidylglycerophosphatase A